MVGEGHGRGIKPGEMDRVMERDRGMEWERARERERGIGEGGKWKRDGAMVE